MLPRLLQEWLFEETIGADQVQGFRPCHIIKDKAASAGQEETFHDEVAFFPRSHHVGHEQSGERMMKTDPKPKAILQEAYHCWLRGISWPAAAPQRFNFHI
jgi:hypothetical protein